jgi:hypothetical protein
MNKPLFKVKGINDKGRWLVERPDGLMCSGTWASMESAQESCDKWNSRKSSWEIFSK